MLSVPFPLRFLFANYPAIMGRVLGIAYQAIATYLCHKAGFTAREARTGAVTLVQRFGWSGIPAALNLNIHFHVLYLDGAYIQAPYRKLRFRQIAPPTKDELETLLHSISHRTARFLERKGLIERDAENSYLSLGDLDADEAAAMPDLYGHSITYRIALGPQHGKKVFSLQTLPPRSSRNTHTGIDKLTSLHLKNGASIFRPLPCSIR